MASKRYIVVDGTRYWWIMTTEETIRVLVRAADVQGGRTMATYFAHGNLVTPWLVSEAIKHALAHGWT
ncbi:MAG: hypothetical protein H0T79_11980, partial [Deltaproteobacteria bacterium]|nr:hypothetical protein [Deltaproteobacteria bacterium]